MGCTVWKVVVSVAKAIGLWCPPAEWFGWQRVGTLRDWKLPRKLADATFV